MAQSRYRNINTIDDKKYYESTNFPSQEKLDNIACFQIIVSNFERLDNVASRYYGSGEYWWVIALINDIDWAYGLEEGQVLKIPIDVQDVLKLF